VVQPADRGTAPTAPASALSVIVPAVNTIEDLDDCLSALAIASERTPLEVLVVDRHGEAFVDAIRRRHPGVRVLGAAAGTTIPDMRAMGFAVATAPVVAVIEDHVIVPEMWAQQMIDAHQRGEMVVGGAVHNAATDRTIDWAAFLCEYSHLLPPLPSGPASSITGNNTTYRRELLERFRQAATSGRWEDHLHAVMRQHGIELYCRPEIAVGHKKHYRLSEYMSQRYLYARSYAAMRLTRASVARRLAYAGAAATLLAPLLLARIVGRVWARPPYRAVLIQSLPLLPVFVAAWAAGEVAGAVLGPGDALSRVC
jgi:hypothetical protein